METKHLICIGCPMGCELTCQVEEGKVITVKGNSCAIGVTYAQKEITNPTRIITTVIPVHHGSETMVSVKTSKDLPKSEIVSCIAALKGFSVEAPIAIGDILFENICGSGVDIIATKAVKRVE